MKLAIYNPSHPSPAGYRPTKSDFVVNSTRDMLTPVSDEGRRRDLPHKDARDLNVLQGSHHIHAECLYHIKACTVIDELNSRFGCSGVQFERGHGGLTKVKLSTERSTAEVYLHGGHVTGFQLSGQDPILWMSNLAIYDGKKALRGGIPVIFPWFGPHPSDASQAQHGFARNLLWKVNNASSTETTSTLQLSLTSTAETLALWPHEFGLTLNVHLKPESLQVELTVSNKGNEPFEIATALHTYFAVSDISGVSIDGFDGATFIDQLDGGARQVQAGRITFAREVDRIYLQTGNAEIRDSQANRTIQVESTGSNSTVIWNPWIDKAQRMGDFPDEGYQQMVCVETANAADDRRTLDAKASHTLSQTISCRQLANG